MDKLDGGFVWDWDNGLGLVVGCRHSPGFSWERDLSLQVDVLAVGLGCFSSGSVVLDSSDKLLTALGVVDVLDTDVDTLLHVSVADLLVDNDTDGALGDVVDNAGLSVVDLVWHTIQRVS